MIAFTYIHTLFSTQEFKIDSDNNLVINKLSAFNASSIKIPLDDINPAFKTTHSLFSVEYIYTNSRNGKKLFSIKHSTNTVGDSARDFIETLNKQIKDPRTFNLSSVKASKLEYKKQLQHLNALLNIGIINDVMYQNIHSRIEDIVYGIKDRRTLADVISLSTRETTTGISV